jgi:hypothetical protein
VQAVEPADPLVRDSTDGQAGLNEFGKRSENFRSFGGAAHDYERALVHGDLFLDTARVRNEERRFDTQSKEVAITDRINDGQSIEE